MPQELRIKTSVGDLTFAGLSREFETRDVGLPASRAPLFYTNEYLTSQFWAKNAGQTFKLYNQNTGTISETPLGSWFESFRQEIPYEWRRHCDRLMSQRFAQAARGDIFALCLEPIPSWVVGSGRDASLRVKEVDKAFAGARSIWLSEELPILLHNAAVTSINGVPRQKLLEFYDKSAQADTALVKISRDLGEALLRGTPYQTPPPPPSSPPTQPPFKPVNIAPESESERGPVLTPAHTTRTFTDNGPSFMDRLKAVPGGIIIKPSTTPGPPLPVTVSQEGLSTLVYNNAFSFRTGLTSEEVADVLNAGLKGTPVSAMDQRSVEGVPEYSRVASILRAADALLGKRIILDTDRAILECDAKRGGGFSEYAELAENMLLSELEGTTTAVVWDIGVTKVHLWPKKPAQGPGTIQLAEADFNFSLVTFRGSPDAPIFESTPFRYIDKLDVFKANLDDFLKTPEVQRVLRYAQVYAIGDQIRNTNTPHEDLRRHIDSALRARREIYRPPEKVNVITEDERAAGRVICLRNIEWLSKATEASELLVGSVVVHHQASLLDAPDLRQKLKGVARERLGRLSPYHVPPGAYSDLALFTLALAHGLEGDMRIGAKGTTGVADVWTLMARINGHLAKSDMRAGLAAFSDLPFAQESPSTGTRLSEVTRSCCSFGALYGSLAARGYGVAIVRSLLTGIAEGEAELRKLENIIALPALGILRSHIHDALSCGASIEFLSKRHLGHIEPGVGRSVASMVWAALAKDALGALSPADGRLMEVSQFMGLHRTALISKGALSVGLEEYISKIVPSSARIAQISLEGVPPLQMPDGERNAAKQFQSVGVERMRREEALVGVPTAELESAKRRYAETVARVTLSVQAALREGRSIEQLCSIALAKLHRECALTVGYEKELLIDSMNSGQIDCDTAAFLLYDVFQAAEVPVCLVDVRGHTLLRVGAVYVEASLGMLYGEDEFRRTYGGLCIQGGFGLAGIVSDSVVANYLLGLDAENGGSHGEASRGSSDEMRARVSGMSPQLRSQRLLQLGKSLLVASRESPFEVPIAVRCLEESGQLRQGSPEFVEIKRLIKEWKGKWGGSVFALEGLTGKGVFTATEEQEVFELYLTHAPHRFAPHFIPYTWEHTASIEPIHSMLGAKAAIRRGAFKSLREPNYVTAFRHLSSRPARISRDDNEKNPRNMLEALNERCGHGSELAQQFSRVQELARHLGVADDELYDSTQVWIHPQHDGKRLIRAYYAYERGDYATVIDDIIRPFLKGDMRYPIQDFTIKSAVMYGDEALLRLIRTKLHCGDPKALINTAATSDGCDVIVRQELARLSIKLGFEAAGQQVDRLAATIQRWPVMNRWKGGFDAPQRTDTFIEVHARYLARCELFSPNEPAFLLKALVEESERAGCLGDARNWAREHLGIGTLVEYSIEAKIVREQRGLKSEIEHWRRALRTHDPIVANLHLAPLLIEAQDWHGLTQVGRDLEASGVLMGKLVSLRAAMGLRRYQQVEEYLQALRHAGVPEAAYATELQNLTLHRFPWMRESLLV